MIEYTQDTLPRVKRSEQAHEGRCPRCGGHLTRLVNEWNTKTNEITHEGGKACTNKKCSAKLLEPYLRLGITEFREVDSPDPTILKRIENLENAREEREVKPIEVEPLEAKEDEIKPI